MFNTSARGVIPEHDEGTGRVIHVFAMQEDTSKCLGGRGPPPRPRFKIVDPVESDSLVAELSCGSHACPSDAQTASAISKRVVAPTVDCEQFRREMRLRRIERHI